jgi:hypothetical protein
MDDVVEPSACGRVRENDAAQFFPVDLVFLSKNGGPEFLEDLLIRRLSWLDDLPGDDVSIDCVGSKTAKTSQRVTLAARNPARKAYTKHWHLCKSLRT